MNVKTVCYGRTIVLSERRGIAQEKCWFGWEVELGDNENPAEALNTLRAMADAAEKEEREKYENRVHARNFPQQRYDAPPAFDSPKR